MERGVYQSTKRGRQLLLFDGFQYGSITPTDIDGAIDYHGSVWVLFEAKMVGKDVPRGQRVALERLIQGFRRAHTHGIAMIVEHDITDCGRDIYVRECAVREIYTTETMRWRPPKWPITAKGMADAYIGYYGDRKH